MHECYFIDKIIRNKFCKTRLKRIKNKNVKKKNSFKYFISWPSTHSDSNVGQQAPRL